MQPVGSHARGPEPGADGAPTRTLRPSFTPAPPEAESPRDPTTPPSPGGEAAAPTEQGAETSLAEGPTDRPDVPPIKPLRMESPEYGMQAFLWWRPEVASRDLQVIRDARFGWVKVGFGWRDIEGAVKGA